jgi:hypothetical protein
MKASDLHKQCFMARPAHFGPTRRTAASVLICAKPVGSGTAWDAAETGSYRRPLGWVSATIALNLDGKIVDVPQWPESHVEALRWSWRSCSAGG